MNEIEKIDVLLVDDRPENLVALEALLEDLELNIVKATSGNDALGLVLEYDLALILLDVQMPDMDGFETAELMRGSEKTRHIPIIFVTAISKDMKYVFKGYESGAVDYLFKPLNPDILRSKVKVFLELHRQKKALEKSTLDLKQIVEELKKANHKILEQQRSVIEEERLRVLLQMAGAAAHELSQPLTGLLGNIQLMNLHKDSPEKLAVHLARIEASGQRIADIVEKIRSIRHDDTKPYAAGTSIINLDQKINILSIEDSDDDFEIINAALKGQEQISLWRAGNIHEALEVLEQKKLDIIFLDYLLPDGDGLGFLSRLQEKGLEIPVVLVTGKGDEMIGSQSIQAGAYDYLPKEMVSDKSLSRIIFNTLEKSRLKKEIKIAQKKIAEMSTRIV